MALENVFSWSKSRDEQFRECQRQYFYDKYASWGGWDKNAPRETRLAYILKNLKNRWAWKGESVHHTIEHILKSLRQGKPIECDAGVKLLTDTMRSDYRASKAKKYLDDPKRSLGLFEHEYAKPVSDAVWQKIHAESVECLKNFYSSSLYQELLSDDKKEWLVIEDLEEFDFEGAKIFVKLDFARRKNSLIEIFDWKTGKSDSMDAEVQIGAYALYAMMKWKVTLGEIRAYLFNVSTAPAVAQECVVNDALVEKAKTVMRTSIAAMKKLLLDPSKNIPRERSFFKFTENTRLCDFCNFYKICEKYQ